MCTALNAIFATLHSSQSPLSSFTWSSFKRPHTLKKTEKVLKKGHSANVLPYIPVDTPPIFQLLFQILTNLLPSPSRINKLLIIFPWPFNAKNGLITHCQFLPCSHNFQSTATFNTLWLVLQSKMHLPEHTLSPTAILSGIANPNHNHNTLYLKGHPLPPLRF